MARLEAKKIDPRKEKYKELDGASEMFWRSHFNDFPPHARQFMQSNSDPLLAGLDMAGESWNDYANIREDKWPKG